MLNLYLKVEVSVGTDFDIAVHDTKELCTQLNLSRIEFSFNGIQTCVSQKTIVEEAEKQFRLAIKQGKPYPDIIV